MLDKLNKLYLKIKGKEKHSEATPEILVSYEVKREIIDSYRKKFELDLLIETGTFLGDTIDFFKNKFSMLYSIELSKELAERAAKRFEQESNISIIQGNSGEVFKTLVPSLSMPALFWLDGHYSSEFFLNGEYIVTAKGDKNTPIEQELSILLKSSYKNVVLIDDARLFTGTADYPTLDAINQMILSYQYTISVDSDIIQLIPS